MDDGPRWKWNRRKILSHDNLETEYKALSIN